MDSNQVVEEEELADCIACGEEKPVDGGEEVVIDRTYVDHMLVSEDSEFVCADCVSVAEEAQVERQLESRYWRGYNEFSRRYG